MSNAQQPTPALQPHQPPSHRAPPINNFDIALRMRDFEIAQLSQRNNFFMIFQGVLFAGLVQSAHTKPVVSFMVCVAGFVVVVRHVHDETCQRHQESHWAAQDRISCSNSYRIPLKPCCLKNLLIRRQSTVAGTTNSFALNYHGKFSFVFRVTPITFPLHIVAVRNPSHQRLLSLSLA